jgi:biopolymer transport protein TolR
MGMAIGKVGESEVAEINMTPMIDVLLVLLMVFIIVQMNLQRAFDLQLPVDAGPYERPGRIVMEIEPGNVLKVNRQEIAAPQLAGFLREIYRNRPDKVLFVKAAPDVRYGDVIGHIDTARSAGVTVIGTMLQTALAPR